jgi:hypothetical protein
VLNFDADNVTVVFDAETGLWHNRGTWYPEENKFHSWRPRFHAYAFGEHRILDAVDGNLYRLSPTHMRDVDSKMIRRVRRAPALSDENGRVFYPDLEIDVEPGLGITVSTVSFDMYAISTDLTGLVLDEDDEPMGGVEVIITVDGETIGTTTTAADGTYSFGGVPDGEVIVYVNTEVDGECMSGQATGTADGPTPNQVIIGSPGNLYLPIDVGPCALDITFNVDIDGNGPYGSHQPNDDGIMTLTPSVVGGSGTYTYEWLIYNENTSSGAPLTTSTSALPVIDLTTVVGSTSCGGQVLLHVTDSITLQEQFTVTSDNMGSFGGDPYSWDWTCI